MGPVLVHQDTTEAKTNVNKRIEFIQSEIKRREAQLKDLTAKQESKKLEIVNLQTAMQQQKEEGLNAQTQSLKV